MYKRYFYKNKTFALNRAQFPAACFLLNILIFCDITINSYGDDLSYTGRIIISANDKQQEEDKVIFHFSRKKTA